jgi:hypothetical protein
MAPGRNGDLFHASFTSSLLNTLRRFRPRQPVDLPAAANRLRKPPGDQSTNGMKYTASEK